MPEVTDSTELLLAQYIVAALQRKIIYNTKPIDAASVFICATEIDSVVGGFSIFPLFVVVPGPAQPNDTVGGHGAQDGGPCLIRRQHYTIHVYQQFNLDRYGVSQQQIIQQTIGLMDVFEQIRDLFAVVQFGNADGSACLLAEPMRYEGEMGNIPVDTERGIIRRDFAYSCAYGVDLPRAATLTLADVT